MALEVEMRWSAAHEDDKDWFGPIVADTISLLNAWAEIPSNAETAVEQAVSAYFDDDSEWEEQFGNDTANATIQVEVHGPPTVAGKYMVDLERTVKARAKRIETV